MCLSGLWGCADEILEKNTNNKLKTATDKDLIRLETITFLKFGAKIRVQYRKRKQFKE